MACGSAQVESTIKEKCEEGYAMLDDLRRSTSDDDGLYDDLDEGSADEFSAYEPDIRRGGDGLFLGMTAVERMFLSIFLFMNVLVLGLAILLATNRISF
jgi:hypothetical protein